MAAALDDILTATKNIVTALNYAASTYLNVTGATNVTGITAATVVKASAGRICTVVVVVGGSGAGAIYDTVSASSTTGQVYTVSTTPGSYVVNMPMVNGIVVAPGSGQTLAVSYS